VKTSTLAANGVSDECAALISRLIDMIPWPARRSAKGDVTLTLLEGRSRTAEDSFGWCRESVAVGIKESQSGIICLNDISSRHRKRVEFKDTKLMDAIIEIITPHAHAEPRLRTDLIYTNMTAQKVRDTLVEKGWSIENLPTRRTISNILNRHGYRLRTVAKSKVKKKS
jgi:hypothetical protein